MLRRGAPALAVYLLLAAGACAFAQMVVIPIAASPHARPWTMADTRAAALRVSADAERVRAPEAEATTTTTTTTAPSTTTTSIPPARPTTARPPAPTAAPRPLPPPAPSPSAALPARGHATAGGCDAALTYLRAYAAPGFTLECPGYAEGHQGMTCMYEAACPGAAVIAIADACAQSYMNEASNSWVLTGRSDAPIDPYGAC